MKKIAYCLLAGLLWLLISSCAATTVRGTWRDSSYTLPVRKVLIVGILNNETNRRIFEDEFCQRLQRYGVEAIASYPSFSVDELQDRHSISEKIKRQGFDTMLISKITGIQSKEAIIPGRTYFMGNRYEPPYFHNRWYDYYDRSYDVYPEPYQVEEYKVITMENNLYNTETEKLIWSLISETVAEGPTEKMIKPFTALLSEKLANEKLL